MHERFPSHDDAVRYWFSMQGWPVTRVHYLFDYDILAWRHGARSQSFTLYITRAVLEDTPPPTLSAALDSLGVAELIRRRPHAYTVLVSTPTGVSVVQPEALPR